MKFVMPKVDKLLNDKNVLYVVFAVAILNLMGYLLVQNTEAIVFFLIVGFLSTYFSKNMIIVLIIAMVSTSIFTSTRGRYMKEGMRTNREAPKEDADKMEAKSADLAKKSDKDKKKMPADSEMKSDEDDDEEPEPEAMTNKSNTKKNRLDYAGNLAEAYNNLQKTIGKGGIKALTGQTETLLNQQKNLMDNIKGMEPFIKTAESFMSKLDLGGINGMLSKLGGK